MTSADNLNETTYTGINMNLDFLRRLQIGFATATDVTQLEPCGSFGESHPIDQRYADVPKTEGFPNPWHIGTINRQHYPDPNELIQGELELLVFLFGLVVQLKPKLIFESGTNVGLTTRAMAAGVWVNGFGTVESAEVDRRYVEFARRVCTGLPAVIHQSPALDCSALQEADLVFIDSSYESRSQEHNLIKSGAVYVMHDSYAEPFIKPWIEHESFKVHIETPRGFSIVRKP